MERLVSFTIWLVISVACASIHKNKGYSPFTGFLWGGFFSIIGLIVLLLEKDKEEHDLLMNSKHEMAIWQWLLMFLGIGIVLIIIFFIIIR